MKINRINASRGLSSLGLALALALMTAITVFADNGPHGGYGPATDACAGCHRAHTAQAGKLLVNSSVALCESCHGATASGADTNVWDGVYANRASVGAYGVVGDSLKSGGFANAFMDTDDNGTPDGNSRAVTSNHLYDGASGMMWGNGALNSGAGISLALSCTNCHNPHGRSGAGGTATYRILRSIPTGSGASSGVDVSDVTTKIYTIANVNGAHNYWGESSTGLVSSWCAQCHGRYLAGSGSGHIDSTDTIFRYRHTSDASGLACTTCHVAHGTAATMGPSSGAVPWPDGGTTPNANARSSLLRLDNRGTCAKCHVTTGGGIGGGACDTCHGAPPNTGAHARHAGTGAVGYGLTGSFATATSYQYGCGECHPTDQGQHQNGAVDVLLSPGSAPSGSLKSMNASGAAYSGGICGGVYCHSGIQIISGSVGTPLVDANNQYILDSHGNFTYNPYTVTTTRVYQSTPSWNGGSITSCTACHAFPLTTSYPSVQAGVGNSHQWIDDYGYGNLHAWNMSFDPLVCRTCHYGEITQANTWTRLGDVTSYNDVPLASRMGHANGQADVAFDTVDPVVYNASSGAVTYSLASAAYIPSEKACTNVACHKLQNYVQWGTPYRWWTNECDLCHRYGLPAPPPLGAEMAASVGTSDATHSGLNPVTQPCTSCHMEPHGGK